MKINGKFTNGGQIPAHGNEKTSDQLISELSARNRRFRRIINNLAMLNPDAPELACISKLICEAKSVLNEPINH